MGEEIDDNGEIVSVLVPTGALGIGVDETLVQRGLDMGANAIACDAGSTDSGPAYLACGASKYSRESVKHDLRILMRAASEAGIPLLIGSCGTSGTDSGVDWTKDIALEVAREEAIDLNIAVLYSEQNADTIKQKNLDGKVISLPPSEEMKDADVDQCNHIVALMGVEPYIEALRQGANVVLGGRTTDTAILAAVPLMNGSAPAPTWHAAKTAECGGLCTVDPNGGGVIFRIRGNSFEIEPLAVSNACTPFTVSSHMLYENSNPFELIEPGGVLNVESAKYVAVNERSVVVTGARWDQLPYTMKLEGASGGEFQTLMLIGIDDPVVLSDLNEFEHGMLVALRGWIGMTIGADAGKYDISLRLYGWNAVSGRAVPAGSPAPREVGVMLVVTASSQEMATRIAKTCNPLFFHFPLRRGMELPSYAYPFSPAELERGQVYTFRLNHVVQLDDPLELTRMVWVRTGNADIREVLSANAM